MSATYPDPNNLNEYPKDPTAAMTQFENLLADLKVRPLDLLPVPKVVATSVGNGIVTLKWTSEPLKGVYRINHYLIERMRPNESQFFPLRDNVAKGTLTYDDTGATRAGLYKYKVTAVGIGQTSPSAEASVTIT